ncbi:Angiogenic factor with G patch and FHA domains 1 [Araneus ventricosus]|uniref:Angiogenic factor with G patch and FHA domains 1 n=1 Tax=Araneus ventricosus TaxID=182803 RepID=A0A4Y2V1N0_ARAVE|nr:Angiogenic factor with G patch and FHA domains 1 [Araneus ventricosus]
MANSFSNCLSIIDLVKVHAEITFDNESWKYSIEDLGSQNGTFVNEIRLSEPKQKSNPQVLSHGDKLAFGSCKLLIHIHEGYETCDQCEPGQVIAELSSKEVKVAPVLKTKKEKEKERRQEMKRLKKKYGLKVSINFWTKSVNGKSVCLYVQGHANAITQKLEKPDG